MPIALPLYAKLAFACLLIALLLFGLSIGKGLMVPMCFAFLFALLLQPLCHLMEKHRFPRFLAIFVCLVTILICIGFLMFFISSQLMNLIQDATQLQTRFYAIFTDLQTWVTQHFGIAKAKQLTWMKSSATSWLESSGAFLSGTLATTTHVFVDIGLVLIFIFFFLYYRNFFREFLYRLLATTPTATINDVLYKIRSVVKNYIIGLASVIGIVAAMNTLGLVLLGIDYALFFGVLAAVLAIIPYIGIIIGASLPIILSLVTKDSIWYTVGVVGVFTFTQFVSDNFITPYIVGSKVSVNPLAAMIALILGGVMWGAAGMILAIPFTAIVKVILDVVPAMQPFGFLLGEPPAKQVNPEPDWVDEVKEAVQSKIKRPRYINK